MLTLVSAPAFAFGQSFWDYNNFDHDCDYDEPYHGYYDTEDEYWDEVRSRMNEFNDCLQDEYDDYANDANDDINTIIWLSKNTSSYGSHLENGDYYDGIDNVCDNPGRFTHYGWKPGSWQPYQWEIDNYNFAVNQYNRDLNEYKRCRSNWVDEANYDIREIRNEKSNAFSDIEHEWKSNIYSNGYWKG